MRARSILILMLPAILLGWCITTLRWSTTSTEDVLLSSGSVIKVDRTTHFEQAGSDTTLGFGRGGKAREWSLSFISPNNPSQEIMWEAEDRIPIILDSDEKLGQFFIVAVKPYSNGVLGDHHWPNGNQNPYYVYEFDGQSWKEIGFHSDLIGRRNNLLVRFEHFYVESPTPRNIGHMALQEKAKLQLKQDAEIDSDRYKYNLKYRVIGDNVAPKQTSSHETTQTSNFSVNRTTGKLRLPVPSSLRSSSADRLPRTLNARFKKFRCQQPTQTSQCQHIAINFRFSPKPSLKK